MKFFPIILSLAITLFVSCNSGESTNEAEKEEVKPTMLSISLKPGSQFHFNAYPHFVRGITFVNNSDKDTIITKQLLSDKPLLIAYLTFLMLPEGPVFRTYSLLLNPGDSVLLSEGVDKALVMQSSTGFPQFIDSLISIPKEYYLGERKPSENLSTSGLTEIVKNTDELYRKNEAVIDRLKLDESHANSLKDLNVNIKFSSVAVLVNQSPLDDSSIIDSLYNDMYRKKDHIFSINALNNRQIFEALVSYNARIQNKDLNFEDLWMSAAYADQEFRSTGLFKDGMLSSLVHNFYQQPETVHEINKTLETIRERDPFLDSLYLLTNILSKTFTDFKQAKTELTTFSGGKYSFILEDESTNHEQLTIQGLPPVTLFNFAGKGFDFEKVVTVDDYQLTLIDFWASWCIPCLSEMPALKKIEEKLSGKPIQFVAISIDKDEDIDKWVATAKKNNLFNRPNQYRLANFEKSNLTRLISLKTIPRYLVIDNKGNILDADFLRPSDKRFEFELLKYLD